MEENTTFPIVGYVHAEGYGKIPVLGIRMMDDTRERELSARCVQRWNERKERDRTADIAI